MPNSSATVAYDAVVPIESKLIRSKGEWTTQPHILFDGYVFVRMDYEWSKYYVFKGIPNIIRLLGGGTSPIPLNGHRIRVYFDFERTFENSLGA